jgi:hypothetical protein
MTQLILKRAPIGWNQNDYDVLEDGVIVGRIFFLDAAGSGGTSCAAHSSRTASRLRCSASRPNCATAAASAVRSSGAFTVPSGKARDRRSDTRQEQSVCLGGFFEVGMLPLT